MPANYLHGVASDLLSAAQNGLTQACTGHEEPERVYVAHGVPVVDGCANTHGQLTVHLSKIGTRPVSPRTNRTPGANQCQIMAVAQFAIQLFRCVPVPNDRGVPPTDTALDESAADLMLDAWALYSHIIAERAAGDLISGLGCDGVAIGEITPIAPSGGTAGWQFTVDVMLSDAGPCAGS